MGMECTTSPPICWVMMANGGRFDMRLNDEVICTAFSDHNNAGFDYPSGSCSAIVDVVAGNVYFTMHYRSGTVNSKSFVGKVLLRINLN